MSIYIISFPCGATASQTMKFSRLAAVLTVLLNTFGEHEDADFPTVSFQEECAGLQCAI